nr:PREDICTED: uncharacterized protein LOC105678445 isoform X2 [Linepithema humile]
MKLCFTNTLNPLLNPINNFDWKSLVMDMLNDIPKHIQTYVAEVSAYRIELRKDKDFIKLKFSLDLVKGTPEQFWENVTMPLSLSSMELIRRHEILLDLIKRKDEEIAEYKAEGAELIRKYIATKPFSEELFHINTATPVGIDFVKAFQSVICFYNAINLPKLHIKTESEISSNNASDNNVLNNENVYSNLSKNEFVQNLKSDELDEDEQVYTKVEECEAGSSNSKAPILKISSISHTIQRFRKNKKTFNDFIL